MPVLGLIVFVLIAFLLSKHRKHINYRLVTVGILLQFVFALLVLGIPSLGFNGPLQFIFSAANDAIMNLLAYTVEGSKFLFGDLMDTSKIGFIVAFQVLPTIIFFSTLMAVLYHIGIMQYIVNAIAWVMKKVLNTSGAESLSASANIFVGQTEAPLVIRPFIAKLTQSELFCVMVGGMATVAGGVLAAFVGFLQTRIPDIAGHLLTASVLSAPAALVIAKIMHPETETPETLGEIPDEYTKKKIDGNVIEAAARGATEGLSLALNVAAMLLAFIALIALLDGMFGWFGHVIGFSDWGKALVPEALLKGEEARLSFSLILGWLFSPFAFLMGVPADEMAIAGILLGQKVALNEFVAYVNLSQMMDSLSDRTVLILSYALCGFANFSSIGIQIGGIGGIAPSRKSDLAKFGISAVIGGSLAAFMTASIAALLF